MQMPVKKSFDSTKTLTQALSESLASYAQLITLSRGAFFAKLWHDLGNPLSAQGACVQIFGLTDEPIRKDKTLQIARQSFDSFLNAFTL
jgi:hypothetical protein